MCLTAGIACPSDVVGLSQEFTGGLAIHPPRGMEVASMSDERVSIFIYWTDADHWR